MKIKSFIATTLVMVCCVCMAGNAQAQTPDNLTLYTMYGQPKSCADNFESLFKAWGNANITNAKNAKFIKYTALGVVKDTTQVRQYAEKIMSWEYPTILGTTNINQLSFIDSPAKQTKTHTIKFMTYRESMNIIAKEHRTKAIEMTEKMKKKATEQLSQNIEIGYEAFLLQFRYKGRKFESLVFCDPNTYEVMVDMHFKGIALK